MNADHGMALEAIALGLLGLPRPDSPDVPDSQGAGGGAWVMTGIDPEGFDLRAGGRLARMDFAAPVHDAEAARAALVALARKARDLSPKSPGKAG
jgi:hypothetical protein